MKTNQIGLLAGTIWQQLDKDLTDTRISKLAKECKLKQSEFYLALGWLARENKIKILEFEETPYVFPIET